MIEGFSLDEEYFAATTAGFSPDRSSVATIGGFSQAGSIAATLADFSGGGSGETEAGIRITLMAATATTNSSRTGARQRLNGRWRAVCWKAAR
jgi:hypothetical protein